MDLYELAFTAYLYPRITNFDIPYEKFLKTVGKPLDLAKEDHRHALFKWLNGWGCRLPEVEEDRVVDKLRVWSLRYENLLPSKSLLLFTENDYVPVEEAFDALSTWKLKRRSFGPTATSKVLFALRPEAFIPWDTIIREELGFGTRGKNYVAFLRKVRQDLEDIEDQCSRQNLVFSELSDILGRSGVPSLKLLDEYYWVTYTRNCIPPAPAEISKWMSWSSDAT